MSIPRKKLTFSDREFLQVHPDSIDICLNCKAAAFLLSVLFFKHQGRVDNMETIEAENANRQAKGVQLEVGDTWIPIKQEQIIQLAAGLITKKTIIEKATPFLKALGYAEVDESEKVFKYKLDMERMQTAVDANIEGSFPIWLALNADLEKWNEDPEMLAFLAGEGAVIHKAVEAGKKALETGYKSKPLKVKKVTHRVTNVTHKGNKSNPDRLQSSPTQTPLPTALGASSKGKNAAPNNINNNNNNLINDGKDEKKPKITLSEKAAQVLQWWKQEIGAVNTNAYWSNTASALEELAPVINSSEELLDFKTFIDSKPFAQTYFSNNPFTPSAVVNSKVTYLADWLQVKKQRQQYSQQRQQPQPGERRVPVVMNAEETQRLLKQQDEERARHKISGPPAWALARVRRQKVNETQPETTENVG